MRIGNIILPRLARAPAGGVESLVVHGTVQVGQQRRNSAEPLQNRRQQLRSRWLGRDLDNFLRVPLIAVLEPKPDGARQILQRNHHARESVRLRRIVRRAELQNHLVLRAEVNRLQAAPLAQVEEVQAVSVLARQQLFGNNSVLHHSRRAPLAGYGGVINQLPGKNLSPILLSPLHPPPPPPLT